MKRVAGQRCIHPKSLKLFITSLTVFVAAKGAVAVVAWWPMQWIPQRGMHSTQNQFATVHRLQPVTTSSHQTITNVGRHYYECPKIVYYVVIIAGFVVFVNDFNRRFFLFVFVFYFIWVFVLALL